MMIAPLLFTVFTGLSAAGPVTWSFTSAGTGDGKVLVSLIAKVEEGWHIYSTDLPNDEGPLPTEFRFERSEAFEVSVPLREPEPVEEFDPNFSTVVRHHSGTPAFTMLLERKGKEAFTVKGEVEYMVCNDRTCLPPVVVPFEIDVEPIGQ